jgi:hypothetical protein
LQSKKSSNTGTTTHDIHRNLQTLESDGLLYHKQYRKSTILDPKSSSQFHTEMTSLVIENVKLPFCGRKLCKVKGGEGGGGCKQCESARGESGECEEEEEEEERTRRLQTVGIAGVVGGE